MEYENWEFDLEPIQDRIKEYGSYIYNKKISIIDVEAINIELYIPLGYLVAVILEFEETDIMKLDKILISDYIQV